MDFSSFFNTDSDSRPLGLFGTLLSGASRVAGGIGQQRSDAYQAAQADQIAGQEMAAGQYGAQTQQKRTALLESRAQAVAAASGGGASDPGVVDIISGIAGEGAYRSQLAMFQGDDRARTLRMHADQLRAQGNAAARAGYLSGASSLLRGKDTIAAAGQSLFEKYGRGGAPSSIVNPINQSYEPGMVEGDV